MILAIDPGLAKCGIALLDDKQVFLKEIVKRDQVVTRVMELKADKVVVGKGTGSASLIGELKKNLIGVVEIDERNTTLEARKLYWKENPPRGLLCLIPTSFLFPPRPVDDYAAVVVGKRHFKFLQSSA